MSCEADVAGRVRNAVATSDIAVIGMAARLPEADDVQQFLDNLCVGRDSVRELSIERRKRTSVPLGEDYQLNGYIEDIDTFDHAFFGISKGEAQNMAPQHRLLLQTTYQAVENAGYDPATLYGRRVSVYVGDTKIEYSRLAGRLDPTMVMGSHVSAMAGRISRFLGLRGISATVDSACSSSLLAVHQAVDNLVLGDAELALVCGVNLNLFADRKNDDLDIGIRSADGKTRCFSAESDGTGSGEAVVAMLLKPLDQAMRDGDDVHAVIKGVAANNVAGRSSTLTAPDSDAQAEVIKRAWEKAGIDPTTVSYIEAHGTATRLGDPIEIEGIDLAFGGVTSQKHFCAVSSVKSNLGHTWSASGITGLVKAILALRHGLLFPNVHSENLNPLIDFANSAVVVTRELTPWKPSCGVRRAGVSSFGVMGTNVHAVLEESPPRDDLADHGEEQPADGYWIPVSARSAPSLESNVAALKRWIDHHPGLRLRDVQRTLVSGRGHHPHRFCVTAANRAELSEALSRPLTVDLADRTVTRTQAQTQTPAVTVLVVSGRCHASGELTLALRRSHRHFDSLYQQCERAISDGALGDGTGGALGDGTGGALGDGTGGERAGQFAFQYAFYGLLRHIGLEFRHVVGEGAGKHVIDATAGRVELAEALRRARVAGDAESDDLNARVDGLLGNLSRDGRLVFVEMGPLSTVSSAMALRSGAGHSVVAVDNRSDGFPAFLRDLYVEGATWNWDTTAGGGRRIELPSYEFQRIRCWMDDVKAPARTEGTGLATVDPTTTPAETLDGISDVWKHVLGLEVLDPEASFFELGGDSISSTYVISRLQAIFGVELDVFAIFDYDTPSALARHIDEVRVAQSQNRQPVAPV